MATPTSTQNVNLDSFELKIVDAQGQPVNCLGQQRIGPLSEDEPGKHVLRLTLDLDQMPADVFVRWQIKVNAVDGQKDLSTPIPLPQRDTIPAAAQAWLQAAPMIQSEHPDMQKLAAEIRTRATTTQELVTETLAAIADLRRPIPQTHVEFQNDALSFLHTGLGECTAHANLFAALLRANGVPCRAVTGVQKGSGQNMHFRNEYWTPDTGWIHVEPQGRQIQTPRWERVETGVVYPSMEQQGRGFQNYDGVHRFSMIA